MVYRHAPLLMLDVDGVLCPMGAPPPGFVLVEAGGWMGTMAYDPEVIARLVHLHASGVVECQWLTTWEDEAAEFLGPLLGIEGWAVNWARDARPDASAPTRRWWKEQVVRRQLRAGRAVAWVDDDMTDAVDDHQQPAHLSVMAAFPGRVLAIQPDPDVGLLAGHLQQIEAFVANAGPPAPSGSGRALTSALRATDRPRRRRS